MPSINFHFWRGTRWWLAGPGTAIVALALLIPSVRQTIFGQTISGEPVAFWQGQILDKVYPERRPGRNEERIAERSWLAGILEKLGFLERQEIQAPPGLDIDVMQFFANHHDVKVRRFVLTELWSKYHGPMEVIREHLSDSDTSCQLIAAQAVWHLEKDGGISATLNKLLDHNDREVRASAANLLLHMSAEAPEVFVILLKAARDPDPHVRGTVLWSMKNFGERGVPVLLEAINDPDWDVRRTTATLLGELAKGNPDLFDPLARLAQDKNEYVRAQAVQAMYHYGARAVPILGNAMGDPGPWVRYRAYTATSRLGKEGVQLVPLLRSRVVLENNPRDPDHPPSLRVTAIQAICAMAAYEPELFEPISNWIDDRDGEVRHGALLAMQHFGKRGLPVLEAGLRHRLPNMRACALSAAARLGKDATPLIPAILEMKNDTTRPLEHEVAAALNKIDPDRFASPTDNTEPPQKR
jgi:HEAT repeat protein